MKRYFFSLLLLGISSFFLFTPELKAATLYGQVVEINDGDAITILCMKRLVRIQVLGIDAPEQAQLFGDVAKRHLSDLIMEKFVVVEYSGLGPTGNISGRILLQGADIGAQMVRDGAAWVDPKSQSRLPEAAREVYSQSEQAARREKRGLWESPGPVAPWEFVKAQEQKAYPKSTDTQSVSLKSTPPPRPAASLDNLTLMMANVTPSARGGASSSGEFRVNWSELSNERRAWKAFRPEGQNFSVLMPIEGKRLSTTQPTGAEPLTVYLNVAREGLASYAVLWISAQASDEDDVHFLKSTMAGFLHGLSEGAQRNGQEFLCEGTDSQNISAAGYVGREFDWTNCSVPTKARAYTKVVGDQRYMYIAVVMYREQDPNVDKFLKSFRVAGPTKPANTETKASTEKRASTEKK